MNGFIAHVGKSPTKDIAPSTLTITHDKEFYSHFFHCRSDELSNTYTSKEISIFIYGYLQDTQFENNGELNWPEIIKRLKQQGDSGLSSIDGYFSYILFRPSSNPLVFSDRTGYYRLYCATSTEGGWWIASHLSLIQANTKPSSKIDPLWWYEISNYRWTTGSHSADANVQQVPPASYAHLAPNINQLSFLAYWTLPLQQENKKRTELQTIDQLSTLLSNSLRRQANCYSTVAVLLSGGVDSSVLAALAKPLFRKIVLITPVFVQGDNPELDAAKRFAQKLDLEHHLVTLNDDAVADSFSFVMKSTEQILRGAQTLAMNKLLEKAAELKCEAVIYGEAADILCGSNTIKRVLRAFDKTQKANRLLTWAKPIVNKLPAPKKIHLVLNQTLLSVIYDNTQLEYLENGQAFINSLNTLQRKDLELVSQNRLFEQPLSKTTAEQVQHLEKQLQYQGAVMNQMRTMGCLMSAHNLKLITPFIDQAIIDFSSTLSKKDYFGDGFVKPILREIGVKYYSRDLMYLKKRGFPVPVAEWLNTALAKQKNETIHLLSNQYGMDKQEAENDTELLWSFVCLNEMKKHISFHL